METNTTTEPAPEPNWKNIALTALREVQFAIEHLKAPGTGSLYNRTTGEFRHWKERFADTLELMPGYTVDRDAMHALDLPKKQRDKFFKDLKAAKAVKDTEELEALKLEAGF